MEADGKEKVEDEKDEQSKSQDQEALTAVSKVDDDRPLTGVKPKDQDEEFEETELNPDGFFNETNNAGACSVRVALRVRPLIAHEIEGGKICVQCYPDDNQIVIGNERNFTFDKVFDMNSPQNNLFET